jgi:hypothetical protein
MLTVTDNAAGCTCIGSVSASCTMMPTRTTGYSVTGTNAYGSVLATQTKVTVKTAELTLILMQLLD